MVRDLDRPDRELDIRHERAAHAEVVLVDWMLGNTCNHSCSYCPAALHDGSQSWQAERDVLAFFDTLHRHYVRTFGRNVWLQFTGGEPTVHPKIGVFLKEARDRGFRVSLISNGSRTLRFWESVRHALNSIILTYHDEFVDHEHFKLVCSLLSEVMKVHINVTVHPQRFDAIMESAIDIARVVPTSTMSLKPLRIGFGEELYPYTSDQLLRLEQRNTRSDGNTTNLPRSRMIARYANGDSVGLRANEFILRSRNHWRGYVCEAGLESLRISGDGRIYRAVCGVGGLVGRLCEKAELPVSPILCSKDACVCVADILITKRSRDALDTDFGLSP